MNRQKIAQELLNFARDLIAIQRHGPINSVKDLSREDIERISGNTIMKALKQGRDYFDLDEVEIDADASWGGYEKFKIDSLEMQKIDDTSYLGGADLKELFEEEFAIFTDDTTRVWNLDYPNDFQLDEDEAWRSLGGQVKRESVARLNRLFRRWMPEVEALIHFPEGTESLQTRLQLNASLKGNEVVIGYDWPKSEKKKLEKEIYEEFSYLDVLGEPEREYDGPDDDGGSYETDAMEWGGMDSQYTY